MRITGAKVFDPQEGFVSRDLFIEDGLLAGSCTDGEVLDASGCYAIPGLTDLHFHGCVGEDFSDGDPEGLKKIAAYQLSRGVTQFCPAGMTLARPNWPTSPWPTPPPTMTSPWPRSGRGPTT